MKTLDAAHQSWWQIGEVIFGLPFLAAIALQLVVPLWLPREIHIPAILLGGAALIIAGMVLIVLARREFAKRGQPTDPGRPTTRVVTTGVFSISRNPLYLGAAGFLAGIALAINLPWVLVFLLPSLIACHYVLIVPEEKYLIDKFGEEYRTHTTQVRRWIGRI